jgi:multidrug efflux pump subunit AcrA (membrane-fusion protein)
LVSSGQAVSAGEPIAELKADRNLTQVNSAAANVNAAVAARSTAAAQLKAAQADRDKAAADVELQNTQYRRAASLVAQGAQAQQVLDQAVNQRNTAIAALKAAQEQISAAQATLAQNQAQLSRAQADQATAQVDLQNNLVKAPIAGIVGDVTAKVGDYATTDTEITSIIQNGALDFSISVPIERGNQLRVGLPVELLDLAGKPLVTGRISFVSPQVSTNQDILAKASFPNNGKLKDGEFVKARLIWETGSGILVPTNAITRIAGQTFVYVAAKGEAGKAGQSPAGAQAKPSDEQGGKPQQIAQQRLVKLGNIHGNSYQVLEGLKPGEQVVVTGTLNLQDGSPITIAQASTGAQPAQ